MTMEGHGRLLRTGKGAGGQVTQVQTPATGLGPVHQRSMWGQVRKENAQPSRLISQVTASRLSLISESISRYHDRLHTLSAVRQVGAVLMPGHDEQVDLGRHWAHGPERRAPAGRMFGPRGRDRLD